ARTDTDHHPLADLSMDLYQRLDDAGKWWARSRAEFHTRGRSSRFVGTKGVKVARSTLYQQVASELRRAIYSGALGPGDQLPTEADLMQVHGVSRNTVRLALGE